MEGPQDVEVSWGGTAIFKCRVDGDPKPKIIWMRDSLELPAKGDRYSIMEDGSLRIENSQDTDIGQYECMAITPDAEIKSRPARMIVTKPENGKYINTLICKQCINELTYIYFSNTIRETQIHSNT